MIDRNIREVLNLKANTYLEGFSIGKQLIIIPLPSPQSVSMFIKCYSGYDNNVNITSVNKLFPDWFQNAVGRGFDHRLGTTKNTQL